MMKKLTLLLSGFRGWNYNRGAYPIVIVILLCTAAFAQSPPDPADDTEEFRSLLLRVNFEHNSTKLTPSSSTALDSMAARFKRDTRRRYEIHGHDCPDAGDESAMRFSARRVETMVKFLQANGIPAANIVTIINPAPDNIAAEGCTHDRRVDIMTMETRKRERKPDPVAATPDPIPTPKSDPTSGGVDGIDGAVGAATSRPPLTHDDPAAPARDNSGAINRATTPIAPAPDTKPTLAIYMAGDEPQTVRGVHNILGGELARTISESEKYLAVDRTSDILKQIEKEHVYQRTGAVSDDQIKDLGQQLGANYLCISNINPVGKKYYLDARMVDVTTAEIIRTATATSSLKDANEMFRVAKDIALELIETDKARAQRKKMKRIFLCTSIGLDILGAGALAYGYWENENIKELKQNAENKEGGGYPEAISIAQRRDVAYIAGGAFLASGITIHIFF